MTEYSGVVAPSITKEVTGIGLSGTPTPESVKLALDDCAGEADFWNLFHELEFPTRVGSSLIVVNIDGMGDILLGIDPAHGLPDHPVRSLHRSLADGILSRKLTMEEMGVVRSSVRGGRFSLSYRDTFRNWRTLYWWKDWYPARQFGGPMLSAHMLGI